MVGLVGVVGLWSAEGQALPWQLMGVAGSQLAVELQSVTGLVPQPLLLLVSSKPQSWSRGSVGAFG